MSRGRVTAADPRIRKAVDLYRARLTTGEIGASLQVDRRTIARWLNIAAAADPTLQRRGRGWAP